MSAGKFTRTFYVRDDNTAVHPVRVQPETITAWNPITNKARTSDISARVSGGRKTLGLIARRIRLQFPDVDPPTGYKPGGTTAIPVLTKAAFDAIGKNDKVLYLGVQCEVIGKTGEAAN